MTRTESVLRRPEIDSDWNDLVEHFDIRSDTNYLNQGSFGISPRAVVEKRRQWIAALDCQPMDFYVRQLEPLLKSALDALGKFVNSDASNLVFAENATFAMNIVADSFPLQPGDQVLNNNHEYGAVHRIWDRACRRSGAEQVVVRLPDQFESHQQVVDSIFSAVTDKTRLIIVSHITSPTALIMPVPQICEEAARRDIAVCVDGPHAPAHIPLDLEKIGCSYYTASCHKWLAAPLGSGFLYVAPEFQSSIQPPLMSWGRLLPAVPEKWSEEFTWSGTRDPSAYLTVPTAIEYMESIGLDAFQARTRYMQQQTTRELMELTGKTPIGLDLDLWYGTMSHVPLPDGDWSKLQQHLWDSGGFEIPIINFENRWYIRASHHLHNTRPQYDALLDELRRVFA